MHDHARPDHVRRLALVDAVVHAREKLVARVGVVEPGLKVVDVVVFLRGESPPPLRGAFDALCTKSVPGALTIQTLPIRLPIFGMLYIYLSAYMPTYL